MTTDEYLAWAEHEIAAHAADLGELSNDGHIYSPDRGFVAFTVPGMSDFIRRKVLD